MFENGQDLYFMFSETFTYLFIYLFVQNGSGALPTSYPMGTRGFFPEGKAAGA
jgi:hypothetical protein